MTTTLIPLPTDLVLGRGSHEKREAGVCFAEAVAWRAGEQHTDHPACTSPVLGAFCRSLNDRWDDEQRQLLLPYLDRVIGTAGDGHDLKRAWMATDWLVRTYTPAWLDLAGCTEAAAELRSLRRIVDRASCEAAAPAQRGADAARAAARDAAWAAARDAARGAARDAAWAAPGAAARAKLAPTVTTLQGSALDLLDAMIEVG